jgi:hypothetical protein
LGANILTTCANESCRRYAWLRNMTGVVKSFRLSERPSV